MAINGRFRVSMADVFPAGAFVVGEVEAVRDFDKSTAERFVQAKDKESGELVWSVPVLDADEAAPKGAKTVVVKISAAVQPVPPEAVAGLPFRPVEFDGLTVTPYVDDKRNRVAYSLRARAMRAPATSGAKVAGKAGGADGKAAA
ncbi:MAG TPA: plasmid replication, integration and excision activator [Pseudonocardiaceae bacterium]|nr:plasmid replication, integration and excision activator [Pseudonocardiaceae bacterium]